MVSTLGLARERLNLDGVGLPQNVIVVVVVIHSLNNTNKMHTYKQTIKKEKNRHTKDKEKKIGGAWGERSALHWAGVEPGPRINLCPKMANSGPDQRSASRQEPAETDSWTQWHVPTVHVLTFT